MHIVGARIKEIMALLLVMECKVKLDADWISKEILCMDGPLLIKDNNLIFSNNREVRSQFAIRRGLS